MLLFIRMIDFKTFVNDPFGGEDNWTEEHNNRNDVFGLFDLPFFNRMYEFLTKTKKHGLWENMHSFINDESSVNEDGQLQVIAGGVGLLYLFIQKNWVSPDVPLDDRIMKMTQFETLENVLKALVVDGENVISVVEVPELLFLSKIILESAYNTFGNSLATKIWYLRCLFIHQQVLEELSTKLCDKIGEIINEIGKELSNMPRNLATLCHLEFARIFMYYQNVQKSRTDIQKATKISGIEISLSGALGKRTKFQTKDLAQLVLKIDLENTKDLDSPPGPVCSCPQPKDIKLHDEVRLDKIKYADAIHNDYPRLTESQQAVVLGNLFQTKKSQPKDNLANEELQPLINCVLDQSKVWSIRTATLLLRSKMEANHKRTVERAMMQVQVLFDSLKELGSGDRERFRYFFTSYLPPKWEVQSTLAKILASMGSIKSALNVYESLRDWENVINCYNALQLRHKAQEVIEQELEKDPSPKMWCLLGDATDDVSCYEKAWEMSNRRSARSQRHWAYYHYYRKNYAESIDHFQKSLEINSLQKELWYRLGFAALMVEKWEVSAQAYRRYCVLDPECFEAWNNLGRCYCELNQKYRAWRALQEALKVDYSNWKVWDNYMLVSSDLQEFDEVIKSYHEILNLKEKHLDLAVLNSLVAGLKSRKETVLEKLNESKLKGKLLELFGRLTSQVINEGELWFLYSEVVDADTQENTIKKHQLLVKAHRSLLNKAGWEKKLENCNRVVHVLSKMVEVGLGIRDPNILLSCKMSATGVLSRIKKTFPEAEICHELERNLEKLDEILES